MPERPHLACRSFLEYFDVLETNCPGLTDARSLDQVRYLESYLRNRQVAAKTIIVETPYIDRHWMEEYAAYYARLLHPPCSHATRLHFFSSQFDTDALHEFIRSACDGSADDVQQELNEVYLGFVVVRPLPAAPVGRTILKTYGGDPNRCYEPTSIKNYVHLAGLELTVDGLPFQQQDLGVGACATAALWSALTKAMRTDGRRPLSPSKVTRAATSHQLSSRGSPASAGLNLEQMAATVVAAGHEPHVFGTDENEQAFLLALKCYMRSGIPVVARVLMEDGLDMHALTLVGFREQPEFQADGGILVPIGRQFLQARGITAQRQLLIPENDNYISPS